MEWDAHFQIHLSHMLQVPNKYGPPRGPIWWEIPISRAFLYISLRVPSKGALPPGSPHRAPIEETLHFHSPALSVLQIPWATSPLQVSQWGPFGERFPIPEPFFAYLWRSTVIKPSFTVSAKSTINEPPYSFPSQRPIRERRSISRTLLHLSVRVLGKPVRAQSLFLNVFLSSY